ncbi:Protein NRT1/PTR FAMILY 5.5 [Abeliophyllum distichum]|uniref:Protein NRT1/PTR FAMILY 5.5 n=1 Tax=Abeliophyllum distichum TaxID=126358 RepID=A0ABD1R8L5_9LAMI
MHPQPDDVQNADVPVIIKEEAQIGGSMDDNANNQASKNQESKLAKALAICTIAGMGIINLMSSLPMAMMNTYLTNVWNLSLTNAAGIVNIWEGISMILPIVIAYLSDTRMSIYPVHLMRTIVYTIGLGLLAMSTPSVFSKFTGKCSDDKPECIGLTQRIMFFTSLALMAVGIPVDHNPKKEIQRGNLLLNMARVLVASAFKISQKLPDDPAQLYENIDQSNVHSLSHTPGLRWLDKAAIILPNESQKENKWKLCTVTQVEETKLVIRTIPMFISFTFCGLVKSIGNTYFLEQANNMNRKMGNLKLPILFLPMLQELMKLYWESTLKQRTATYSVIVNSVVCCTIAASVERRSMLDSYLEKSVENLFPDEIPLSRRKYLIHFAHGASGVGTVGGVLSVNVVGKISEIGGKNWFQYTLNRSRLDRYYWTLSVLGALNIIVSVLSSWKIVIQFLSYVGES